MDNKHSACHLAVRSKQIATVTMLIGGIWFSFYVLILLPVADLGIIATVPVLIAIVTLMMFGGMMGTAFGIMALYFIKRMPFDAEKSSYKHYAMLGITLGIIQLGLGGSFFSEFLF